MPADKDNGRTHEPSLRELTAELDGLRELFMAKISAQKEIMDERDRLYKERDETRVLAVDSALKAVEKQTEISFVASERALQKAEASQQNYNIRSNEFRGQLEDQARRLMSKDEYVSSHKNLELRVDRVDMDVRRIQTELSAMAGSKETSTVGRHHNEWLVGTILGGVALITAVAGMIASFVWHGK